MAGLPLAVGQTIELNDGRRAIIRFLGSTGFAPGEWIGVELDEPSGKNDGSVKGDRYFDCDANYGMFLRSAGVGKIVETPRARPASKSYTNGPAAGKTRPSSISSNVGAAKRESVAGASALRLPARSPTKQLGLVSAAQSKTAAPPTTASRRPATATTTKARASISSATPSLAHKRTSTLNATPASSTRNAARASIAGQTPTSRAPARAAPGRQALAPPRVPGTHLSSVTSNTSDDLNDSPAGQPSPLPSPAQEKVAPHFADDTLAREAPVDDDDDDDDDEDDAPASYAPAPPQSTSMRPPPRRASSPHATASSARTSRGAAVPSRELEDLQAKMRILERKRLEDRERLKKMGELEQERDKYASVTQKLQTKLQTQSQELAELRRQLKESETSLLDIEAIQAEHDSVVEMATLDREMAEETAEVLKTEVEALRSKNEEMSLELEILREENSELGREMNPEERTSQGWLQMERSNERLREALLRLRDITQEQEAELKDQVTALEEEVKDFATYKTNYEDMREKLLGTEADLDDLRQQLEAALGAEDMIEELTERNMSLQEDMEELRATVEDLESLKELNDELEVNHVEAEKQMQEEIDFKDSLINENVRRIAQQAQAVEDCEYTISRFRELVTNLQADLEDMRASQQLTDKEAEDLSHRSRAMMDLNMKLQISASKTQVKTIDLELRRLEAEEASEHLSIVQLFLPEAFHAERDSVLALLRFKRISFKANLVHGFVRERISGQSVNLTDTNLFAACSVIDRLTWISAMGERFINSIGCCSVEDFAKYEGALYELEPVERALNSYIEALKRNDLNEKHVDDELQRSIAVMTHLASLHIRVSSAAFADDVLMQTSLIQTHLETTASAFALCKSLVQVNVPGLDNEEEDDETLEPSLMEKFDAFISHARSAKVIAGKTHRALSELQTRHLALEPSRMELFVTAEQAASKLTTFTRAAGEALQTLFGEEGREQPYSVSEVNLALSRLTTGVFELPVPESSTLATVATSLRSLTESLNNLAAIPGDLDNTVEFERALAPWVVRSTELRSTKLTSVDTEAEVARLTEILRERSLLVRTKEQELEEQSVRIEMLEARMTEAQKRSAQLGELEAAVQASKQTEKALETQLSEAIRDLQRLRRERDELREQLSEHQVSANDANAPNVEFSGGASRVELEHAKAQEKNLQAAIRYLRKTPASANTIAADLEWLEEPLFPTPTLPQRGLRSLESEAKSAISELLNVVSNSQPVKINMQTSKNRLAWQPAQETTAWAIQKKREEWETWREWQFDLLSRAKDFDNPSFNRFGSPRKQHMDDYGAVGHVVVVGE